MRDRETPIWTTPDNNTTDPQVLADLLAVTPEPTPLNRAKAVLVLYTAALYNAWFSNPTELKVRTWAEMFTEPEFTMANLEWAAIDALAAIARKYPDIELTTDEILEAAAWKPKALFHRNLNVWKLAVTRRITTGDAG